MLSLCASRVFVDGFVNLVFQMFPDNSRDSFLLMFWQLTDSWLVVPILPVIASWRWQIHLRFVRNDLVLIWSGHKPMLRKGMPLRDRLVFLRHSFFWLCFVLTSQIYDITYFGPCSQPAVAVVKISPFGLVGASYYPQHETVTSSTRCPRKTSFSFHSSSTLSIPTNPTTGPWNHSGFPGEQSLRDFESTREWTHHLHQGGKVMDVIWCHGEQTSNVRKERLNWVAVVKWFLYRNSRRKCWVMIDIHIQMYIHIHLIVHAIQQHCICSSFQRKKMSIIKLFWKLSSVCSYTWFWQQKT